MILCPPRCWNYKLSPQNFEIVFYYVDLAGLELKDSPALTFWVLCLKVCTPCPASCTDFWFLNFRARLKKMELSGLHGPVLQQIDYRESLTLSLFCFWNRVSLHWPWTYYAAKAGLELLILLPLPAVSWNYIYIPLCLETFTLLMNSLLSSYLRFCGFFCVCTYFVWLYLATNERVLLATFQ